MSCLPGASGPAQQPMRPPIAQGPLPRQTSENLGTFSTPSNASLAGWWQYDGSFSPTTVWTVCRHFDLPLARGACRQYKTLRGHKRRSRRWLAKVSRRESELFVHWRLWYGRAREGEPCASRGSRTVLRAAEGAVPLADSPVARIGCTLSLFGCRQYTTGERLFRSSSKPLQQYKQKRGFP
ncbi:MAG TPA: hypothetical protein VKK81_07130, partial [Candidatus Binatia bacterium]|nr:hypothetical protein [Candidatus Binatia bacterium]